MTPQEKSRDKRLQKTYGWTLEMVNALSEAQGHRCAACGRFAKDMPLNVDHKHFKVTARRLTDEGYALPSQSKPVKYWLAQTTINGQTFGGTAKTKTEAIAIVKKAAMPYSVRGLLCAGRYAGCNRKLGRIDDSQWLRRCADYVDNWPSRAVFPAKTVQKVHE
jgi:hypothetical protein